MVSEYILKTNVFDSVLFKATERHSSKIFYFYFVKTKFNVIYYFLKTCHVYRCLVIDLVIFSTVASEERHNDIEDF